MHDGMGTGEGSDQHIMATQQAGMPLFIFPTPICSSGLPVRMGMEEAGEGEEIQHHNLN